MARVRIALVAIMFLGIAATRAGAANADPAPAATATAAQVTPEQAARALAVLQDAHKREDLIETLQTIAHASPPVAAAPTTPKPESTVLALQPDSLGAELVVQAAGWAQDVSADALSASRVITNAPALWRGLRQLAANPAARAGALDASWRLAIALVVAFAAEQLLALALRRPMASLGRERIPGPPETRVAGVAADNWRFLRRLPQALLRLMLMLLPVGAFAGAGMLLTFAEVGASDATRLIILEILKAYVVCRAVVSLARALASSDRPRLRLLRVDDGTAAYIEVWARRLVVVTVVGATLAETTNLLGGDPRLRYGLVKLVALVLALCLLTIVFQCRTGVANWLRAPESAAGVLAALRNRTAEIWHFGAIAAIAALWFLWAVRTQNGSSRVLQLIVVSAAALAAIRVFAIVALGALDRAFHTRKDLAARFPGLDASAIRYYRALRGALSFAVVCLAGVALLEIWGVDVMAGFAPGAFGGRLVSALAIIGVAVVTSVAVWEVVNAAMDRHLGRLASGASYQRAARLRTLLPILRTTLMIAILTVLALTALSEIGVNIAPLLAGAGIVGIAIGFGSQKLVQDIITGLFLLLENAIQVGDWVTAAGLSGSVETLSIRTMRLRAADGAVHIVPFSSVTSVTNANRGRGNAAISVCVSFDEDTDRVEQALKQIAVEMRQEAKFRTAMLGEVELWGVDKVDGAGATIVGQIACTDAGRWEVQREFNRRMKQRFQELGIRIAPPTPTVVLAPQVVRADQGAEAEPGPDEPQARRRPARSRKSSSQ